ncbi:MAG: gamma-glutamyl-gamma-aminobutyrate hydrolase family protein [Actinomycetota bacterium]
MATKRAAVIVHDPTETPSMVGRRLRDHGYELVEYVVSAEVGQAHSDMPFPDPADFELVVVMGAIHSVYDEETIGSWIGRELDFLRAADGAEVPVLGICFGAQALAAAHGGSVVRAERPQVGWHRIPAAPGMGTGPWMQWHYDRLEVPPAATVLSVDEYGVQAFVLGRHLGLQFHPEVDPEHLQRWLDHGGDAELAKLGLDAEAIMDDARTHADQGRTSALVDWFLAEVAHLTDGEIGAPGDPTEAA